MRQLIFQFFFSYSKSLVPKSRYESIQHSSAKSLTENNNNLYVGNAGSGDVSVIDVDINEVIETINVLSNPYDLEFSSFDNYVYMMNQPYVSIIDTRSNTVFANIQVDNNLIEIQVNSNNGNIYVSSSSNYALECNPENNAIYVANRDSDDISVIDGSANDVIDTVLVGNYPFTTLEYNPITNKIYVANGVPKLFLL